ncbi:MAG: TAT-dependent nitrous-oxide reductase, partial [Halorientalis sp.]
MTSNTPSDTPDTDPAEVVDRYEQQLESLLAEVEEPAEEAADATLELAGLELNRRDVMKTGAAVGLTAGLAGCAGIMNNGGGGGSQSSDSVPDHKVPPGEHDEYYGFWSGGHSGEIRVLGIPSMRELMRIPVFNTEGARGYGYDDKTSEMLEEGGGYTWGDNHHPALSETGGDYDGEYLYVNDKANGRVARVNLKYFETDAITDVPNMQTIHGCCVQSPDTKYIFGNGEFRVPLPNDGRNVNSPDEYASLFTAVNPETMETEWQVEVDGNLDIVDTDKDGRWAISSAYNSEEAVQVEGMTHDDRDYVKAFDVPAIEQAVEAGNYEEINGVPVVDGTRDSSLNEGDRPIVRYIPTPKSPHCV